MRTEVDQLETLLIEIGTEEIPARFIEPAKEGLSRLLSEGLAASRISFGEMVVQGTPRRLSALVYNVAEKQEETVIVKFGPPVNRAFDESGNPNKAAVGFAKSQGVAVEELKKIEKEGVEFIAVEKKETGRETALVLPDLLRDVIGRVPYQKKMRWGGESFEFARPVQWVLALLGTKTLAFQVADVQSGNTTEGHRFLGRGPLVIDHPDAYRSALRGHYVILDEKDRLAVIMEGIERIEKEVGGFALRDEDLIREILYITEYPYPLKGTFDEPFLAIPKEVLVNVMKSHQRYIPLQNAKGELLPYFIFFANTIPRDDQVVIRGNEKVLRARLADARFFFEEDRRTNLADLFERLSSIVFHVKLGTLKEKVERTLAAARYLGTATGYADPGRVEKATRLAKVDLLTHMVGEFPELQGIMGRIYAGLQGEDTEIARAIEEHYLPTGGDGRLPETDLGALIAIADKVDSLTSFFSVNITPTGNLDPYALRRQSLGVIRIMIDRKLCIPLEEAMRASYEAGSGIKGRIPFEATRDGVAEFISTRFKFAMVEEKHNQDFVESVLPFVARDIYDGYVRLLALENQKSLADFERLMVGFRRVFNITKTITDDLAIDPGRLALPEEQALFGLYEEKRGDFFRLMEARSYPDALSVLVGFKETIDNFFDKVFVMDKDDAVKNNRLALLKKVKDMFLTFGDFSKIRVE